MICHNISFFNVYCSYDKTSKLKSRMSLEEGSLHQNLLGESIIKFI